MNINMSLYRVESDDAKRNAQRNLEGRTHYVDNDSLRYFRSRIASTHITDGGLRFTLLESTSKDPDHTRRCWRFVSFDVFGETQGRVSLAESWNTREQARKAMWAFLNTFDAVAHTLEQIKRQKRRAAFEFDALAKQVRDIKRGAHIATK